MLYFTNLLSNNCQQENGRIFLSLDACFGLPRKKSSGGSYRPPLSENMFFHNQENVDNFMAAYPSSRNLCIKLSLLFLISVNYSLHSKIMFVVAID